MEAALIDARSSVRAHRRRAVGAGAAAVCLVLGPRPVEVGLVDQAILHEEVPGLGGHERS
jgi:hypothetical protein